MTRDKLPNAECRIRTLVQCACSIRRHDVDFSFTEDQQAIRASIEKICADFGDDYWLKKDREGGFPHDFHAALASAGWLGIAMPTDVGGAGLGITEAAIMMQTVAE